MNFWTEKKTKAKKQKLTKHKNMIGKIKEEIKGKGEREKNL